MKRFFLVVSSFFFLFPAWASHNKAGEITFRYISGLTYEAKVITYTDFNSLADRPEIELKWGDGDIDTVKRTNGIPDLNTQIPMGEYIPDSTKYNVYIAKHTYAGPGIYTIALEDANRVSDIVNIPGSLQTVFYIETVLLINTAIGVNNSPVLIYPPLDNGTINQVFIHNANAYDPDGDSLSYKLVVCKGESGNPLPGYTYPNQHPTGSSATFTLDALSGDLVWNTPQMIGIYNAAFLVEEWRNGIKIGYVTRDLQVRIIPSNNQAPFFDPIPNVCVAAGDTIQFQVIASDPSIPSDKIKLSATGEPFMFSVNPAKFPADSGTGLVASTFSWVTSCEHVQKQPYQVLFKVQDDDPKVKLVDLESVNIAIVGPAPENLQVTPLGNSMKLIWERSICPQVTGYRIYRHEGNYPYAIPCPCVTGVPDTTGFVLIGSTGSLVDTTFTDDNQGNGLTHGVDYCYLVVAVYPDGALSCASNQACSQLKKDLPVITNVDIKVTHENTGVIYVAWSKPTELDTIVAPGPYKYLIYRSPGFTGSSLSLIDSTGMTKGLEDTLFTDTHTPLNTSGSPYTYRIDLYNDVPRFLVGTTQKASSVFLAVEPSDNLVKLTWEEQVPWTNTLYTIYRYNTLSLQFDPIGTTVLKQYTDTGLANGTTYCYKVKSTGSYAVQGFVYPIENFSQEVCAAPLDNVPPCAPDLAVDPDCYLFRNFLLWNNPNHTCSDDVLGYKIYFSPSLGGDLTLLITLNSPDDTTFLHDNLKASIAGCYLVVAVDSVGNESKNGNKVCVDNCPVYELPNIFTPNGSGQNDLFHPFPYRYIKEINIRILNRWGQEVFSTTDPDVNWDGKNKDTKGNCPDGVYYYICEVQSIHLDGIKVKTLRGFFHLIH